MTTISSLPIDRLRNLESALRKSIRGQDHVIPAVVRVAEIGEMGLATPGRPKGAFIFIGPTGVGKTELAKCLSQSLYGIAEPFRLDMSEFSASDAIRNFIGDETGSLGRLGNILAAHNRGVLLVDEIEKASRDVMDVFLQILDAACVTCGVGKTFDLSDFYIIMTSNVGAADILKAKHLNFTQIEKHVMAQLAATFRPEFVNRIKTRLVFKKLSYDVQLEIAELNLEREKAFLEKKGHAITFERDVLDFLILKGFDKYFGARPLRDAMELHIRAPIARHLIELNGTSARGHLTAHPAKTHLVFAPA